MAFSSTVWASYPEVGMRGQVLPASANQVTRRLCAIG